MSDPKLQVVKDRIYGLYYWQNPETGAYLSDGDGRFLTLPGKEHDLAAMAKMAAVARELGFPEGKAVWRQGDRQITDAEYDLGMERVLDGKEFDPAEEYLQAVENMQKEKGK